MNKYYKFFRSRKMNQHYIMMLRQFNINILSIILILAGVFVSNSVAALSYCIPNAVGVPALSGPPNWWDDSLPEPNYWPRLDDPRWKQSFGIGFDGSGVTEHVSFRALRHGSGASAALYLSWNIKVDPSLDTSEDILYLGFSPTPDIARGSPGWKQDIVFKITPFNNLTVTPPVLATDVEVLLRNAATGNFEPASNEPDWIAADNPVINHNRIWFDTSDNTWAINVKVPILSGYEDGIDLANHYKMWFEVNIKQPDGSVIYHSSPDLDIGSENSDFGTVVASTDSSAWQSYRRDLSISSSECIKGVSIASSDIGTFNVDSEGNPRPHKIKLTESNVFFAKPLNETGADISPGVISADFRIANWGTGPTWNSVTDPLNSLWTEINPAPVLNTATIADGTKPIDANALQFAWGLDPSDICDFDPSLGVGCTNPAPTKLLHQCMLIELNGPVIFTKKSVHRNMDFVMASKFTRDAEVRVAGIGSVPGVTERDVYLYVQTINMPRRVEPGDKPKLIITGNNFATGSVGSTATASVQGGDVDEFEKNNSRLPTYIVHAYRDTGRTETRNGNTYKILTTQSSFGYYVSHEGSLTGWKHGLEGATLSEIAPNYYKVIVPEGGATSVTTNIEAVENGLSINAKFGINDPQSNLGNFVDSGLSINLGLEYFWSPAISYEAILGFHGFDDKGLGSDLDISQFSLNARYYFASRVVRPYVNAGVGSYKLDPGTTETGYNVGAGIQYDLTSSLYIEAAYNYHEIDATNPDPKFSTLQIGLGYLF